MQSVVGNLIQSNFGSREHGNLETILVEGDKLVHYWRDNTDSELPWKHGQILNPDTSASGPAWIIQSNFGDGEHGNFEVVALEGTQLVHYWHDNSDVNTPWRRGQVITWQATGPGCIIQSDFGDGEHGNFEVVVLEGNNLVHYWHDNSDVSTPWHRAQVITTAATSPGCIIQSDFRSGDHGNFEVVVLEGNALVHYWHDNSDVNRPWERGQVITSDATGPGCIIQSDFRSDAHGNFEVVVLEGRQLVHHWHDNADVNNPWQRAQTISTAANGAGCIIQGDYGSPHGNFEVLAQECETAVTHYWHNNRDVAYPWQRDQILHWNPTPPKIRGTRKVVQLTGEYDRQINKPAHNQTASRFGVTGTDLGSSFLHDGRLFFLFGDTNTDDEIRSDPESALDSVAWTTDPNPLDGVDLTFNLQYPHVPDIAQGGFDVPLDGISLVPIASGPAWIIQSNFGDGEHGNFEVVVLEGRQLVHHWHDNADVNNPWQRGQIITQDATGPACIIQSDFRSDDHGNFEVVVPEGDRLVHYWHDNSDVNKPWQRGQTITDPIDSSACIIQSNFRSGGHGNFEVVVLQGVRIVHYWHDNSDVSKPWERGRDITIPNMYVFFSTDHSDEGAVMGRTVLANSADGGREFGHPLYTLSHEKFINVSVTIVRNENIPGLPDQGGQGLLIFGSGRYRASDVYLAYMPFDQLQRHESLWYFSGQGPRPGPPMWSRNEADAVPLFCGGDVGELSVRWNPYLGRWLMLYNGANPRGIILREAAQPWGDWSSSWLLFDPGDHDTWPGQGYGFFMHQDPDRVHYDDGLSDPDRIHEWGGEYGPYQMTPYATGVNGQYTKIYFTMSTWNPYNAMQMTAAFTLDGQEPDPHAYADSAEAPNDRKYARVSTLMARLAAARGMIWDAPGQGSLSCADHIEWAQFHSYRDLRDELKVKFRQMVDRLPSDTDKADAYAKITNDIVLLGANGLYDFVDYNAHYSWALESIHGGHPEWLVSEMNLRIEREPFLPDHDAYCYAYGPDAPNERKYARTSLLQAQLAVEGGLGWDYPGQGSLDGSAHVAWARFQTVEALRGELKSKFRQMLDRLPNNEAKANAYARLTDLMVGLGADGPFDFIDYSAHHDWALNALNTGNWQWLQSETNLRIDREHFLASTPSF